MSLNKGEGHKTYTTTARYVLQIDIHFGFHISFRQLFSFLTEMEFGEEHKELLT